MALNQFAQLIKVASLVFVIVLVTAVVLILGLSKNMANLATITLKSLKNGKQINYLTNVYCNIWKIGGRNYSAQLELQHQQNSNLNGGPIELLSERVKNGKLMHDDKQFQIAEELQRVYEDIEGYSIQSENIFSKWFNPKQAAPKGLYLYGAVGGGKTMLMDLFYDCCEVIQTKKKIIKKRKKIINFF